jgi:hypothetical protein
MKIPMADIGKFVLIPDLHGTDHKGFIRKGSVDRQVRKFNTVIDITSNYVISMSIYIEKTYSIWITLHGSIEKFTPSEIVVRLDPVPEEYLEDSIYA